MTCDDAQDPNVAVTHTDTQLPGYDECNGFVERTWSAADNCGNTVTDSATVHVVDVTGPVGPNPDVEALVTLSHIDTVLDQGSGQGWWTDACSGVTVTNSASTSEGNCLANKIITRTWSAVDACGNPSQGFTQIVHIQDTTDPYCLPVTDLTYECGQTVTPPVVIAKDKDSNGAAVDVVVTRAVTYTSEYPTGNAACKEVRTYRYSAADACGNIATTTAKVTIEDNTPPTITVPNNQNSECPYVVSEVTATATDDCGSTTVTESVSPPSMASTCVPSLPLMSAA